MIHYSFMVIEGLNTLGDESQVRRLLAFINECGYEGIELNLDLPPAVPFGQLERWVGEAGLVIPSFLTGGAYNRGLCLSSPDPGVRQRTAEHLTRCLEVAMRFKSILVVGLLQGFRKDEPDPARANERIAGCLRQVMDRAEPLGVDLVIEPVNHLQVGFNNSVGEVRQLAARVGSPNLRPMVDTVHMNIEESSLTQPILDCGPSLRHVHLCESNGSLLGSGHIDFKSVLETLDQIKYAGFASVKVYRNAEIQEAARLSMEYLQQLT
jgi:sugar phosphate isomerase/epimerase